MKKLSLILMIFSLLLTACESGTVTSVTEPGEETTPQETIHTEPINPSELFSDRDYETGYNPSACTAMDLSDTGTGTVTITKEGSYLLSGTLSEGMIVVDAGKESKIQLILNGVTIHSSTSAPIYIRQADKVFITLAEGSSNTLQSGDAFQPIDENTIDSTIFSKDDLTLNGTGSLTILSPAGHGIVSKDDLRITGGSYKITAAGHGLSGKDAVSIAGGSFCIESSKDGIQADNDEDTTLGNLYIAGGEYEIASVGDGISASGSLFVDGGNYQLLCGGGSEYGEEHTDDMFGGGGMGGFGPGRPGGRSTDYSLNASADEDTSVSAKGLKAAGDLTVTGGTFTINSADDGIHSNQNITVTGGTFQIATGDDGFHADEKLSIGNGVINITESYEGLEGLSITVTGGDITLKASDDGLNAAGGNDQSGFGGMGGRPGGPGGFGKDQFGASSDSIITISGGKLFVDADGDGIDSNGNLTFSGGYTVVEGPTNGGNGPLDYGGSGTLSGGTIIISGSSGMAQSLNSTGVQGVFAINVGNCDGGTEISITDASGNEILTVTPQKYFGCIIVSTPDILKGESYTIHLNGESAAFDAQ